MSARWFNPQEEKEALYTALCTLHEQWGTNHMGDACAELHDAAERAEHLLSVLATQQEGRGTAFEIHVLGLQTLVGCAHEELARTERYALERVGQRIVRERASGTALDTIFTPGTILSCPGCEYGLYQVRTRATTQGLVLDDGTILVPLNATIPRRDAWTSLACPFCGARLLKAGQIHTLQRGWV